MSGRHLILSAQLGAHADACDPANAGRVIAAAETAKIDLLILGDAVAASAPPFDAAVAAAWMAPRSRCVGLAPMMPAAYCEPFHVARSMSALDFLSGGRGGWMPVTAGDDAEAQRYGRAARPDEAEILGRSADFVAAARSLWDSWDDDALIIDQARGDYLHSAKVRRNAHRGPYFRVLGPLNAARPPQGYPVLIQSDQDPLWRAVAPDILLVGADGAAAEGPLRVGRIDAERLDAGDVEGRFKAGALDGVHLAFDDPAEGLTEFAKRTLPELERRGLVEAAATGASLRQRFGLARPVNPFQAA